MLEEKNKIELGDEELNEVSGGSEEPTTSCPFGRTKYVPFQCNSCVYAPKSSTATCCGKGCPKGTSLDSSVTPI